MIRKFIKTNIRLSRFCEKMLPTKYTRDGNYDFINNFVPKYLKDDLVIYDIGGGKNPYIDSHLKNKINAKVIGFDIDENELKNAPYGIYDEIICADIGKYNGVGDADIVICQCLLEHVADTKNALKSISTMLKDDGVALIFVPNRNAIYSRINTILSKKLRKLILKYLYGNEDNKRGFDVYYDNCTPEQICILSNRNNMNVIEEKYYYVSSYFYFFFPMYIIWRTWVYFFSKINYKQASETFSLALLKHSKV